MPLVVNPTDNIGYRFAANTVNEIVYQPKRLVWDAAFGTIASATLDMTPVPDMVENISGMAGLSSARQAQLGAGLTYSLLKSLEIATKRSLA